MEYHGVNYAIATEEIESTGSIFLGQNKKLLRFDVFGEVLYLKIRLVEKYRISRFGNLL